MKTINEALNELNSAMLHLKHCTAIFDQIRMTDTAAQVELAMIDLKGIQQKAIVEDQRKIIEAEATD